MRYRTIETIVEEPVATLRLHRPERMNAVVEEMYRDIRDALRRFGDNPAARCVILTGSVLVRNGIEKQAFCAGADLKKHARADRTPEERRQYIELAHETVRWIREFPKPVIAAVNGPALGAGAEMALACDFILIEENAILGLPEVGLGTFVGGGVTHTLPRVVGTVRAKELIYTGRILRGREAVELGLALSCHPLKVLMDEVNRLARKLAGQAPMSLRFAKRCIHRCPNLDFGSALRQEGESILECMKTGDWKEGIRAFQEKRKPEFRGT
jgi:enoyl-CoA hydratase